MRAWISGPRYTFLAFGAACLIGCALRPGSLSQWVFERRWLGSFGKYSYGIYVLHMIALSPMLRTFRRIIAEETHSKLLAVVGAGVGALTLSVGAAYLSFHLYEKPFLQLKQHFTSVPEVTNPLLAAAVISVPAQV